MVNKIIWILSYRQGTAKGLKNYIFSVPDLLRRDYIQKEFAEAKCTKEKRTYM